MYLFVYLCIFICTYFHIDMYLYICLFYKFTHRCRAGPRPRPRAPGAPRHDAAARRRLVVVAARGERGVCVRVDCFSRVCFRLRVYVYQYAFSGVCIIVRISWVYI